MVSLRSGTSTPSPNDEASGSGVSSTPTTEMSTSASTTSGMTPSTVGGYTSNTSSITSTYDSEQGATTPPRTDAPPRASASAQPLPPPSPPHTRPPQPTERPENQVEAPPSPRRRPAGERAHRSLEFERYDSVSTLRPRQSPRRTMSTRTGQSVSQVTLARARLEAAQARVEYLEALGIDSGDERQDGTDSEASLRLNHFFDRSQATLAITMREHEVAARASTPAHRTRARRSESHSERTGPPGVSRSVPRNGTAASTETATARHHPSARNEGAMSQPTLPPRTTPRLQTEPSSPNIGGRPTYRAVKNGSVEHDTEPSAPEHTHPVHSTDPRARESIATATAKAAPTDQRYDLQGTVYSPWADDDPQKDVAPAEQRASVSQPLPPPLKQCDTERHEQYRGQYPAGRYQNVPPPTNQGAQPQTLGAPPPPTPAPRYLSELPSFSGAYEDWLSFKSSYQQTAGYFSDLENSYRLKNCLTGAALNEVKSFFYGNTNNHEVLKRLENCFGRPNALVAAELKKLRSLPRMTDEPRDVCTVASQVANVVATMRALERPYLLYNNEMVLAVVDKMTVLLRSRWYDFELGSDQGEPELLKFSRFLDVEADRNRPHARLDVIKPEKPHGAQPGPAKKSQRTYAANAAPVAGQTVAAATHSAPAPRADATKQEDRTCPVCDRQGHRTSECHTFKAATVDHRWELSKLKRLCFRCLRTRTWGHKCHPRPCPVPGCIHKHHPMLHNDAQPASRDAQPTPHHTQRSAVYGTIAAPARNPRFTRAYLKVIPVHLTGPKGEIDTYALMDDGSTVTLVTTQVAEAIGVNGPREPFYIEAVAGARVDATESQRVQFGIRGRHTDRGMQVIAHTINKLDIGAQSVSKETVTDCEHLLDIAELLTYEQATPTVLLGQDNWAALIATEVRKGAANKPVASHTPLGWVLHGLHSSHATIHRVNHLRAHDDTIDSMLREHFALESLGIEPRRPRADPEIRALKLLEETTKPLPNGGYETGLLWKDDHFSFPDNHASTLKRLEGVERKLKKNIELKKRYADQMNIMFHSGYAEVADAAPTPGRTWYLPHFAVINPAKPEKLRIVHDAAASTRGVCLNDLLLTGPDLLQSLTGVLWRFRQRPVAVAADIKDMFLRIKIRYQDRDALRFLWRDDTTTEPVEYRMTSVIFGATSSPCTAIYVKDYNAERHREQYPDAADAITRNHYMDDYLQSFDTAVEAKRVTKEVVEVHKVAQFTLHKWTTNEPEAVRDVTATSAHAAAKALSDGTSSEKILGLIWNPARDTLGFNLNFTKVNPLTLTGEKTPTKREMLQTAMSLYDPLGLVSPVTIQVKHILQETWRHGLDWDTVLPSELEEAWNAWIRDLRNLATLELPRCYPAYATAARIELHTFVDASETAYAAATYWRCTADDGTVTLNLAAARARVAPLKVTSIPRLELQAAVLGARLSDSVEREHDIKPAQRYFWTDSRTVLCWLRAGPRAFKPFVAHRVADIEENARVNEWRWVPTRHNVADDATRQTPPDFDAEHRWFRGPQFLHLDEGEWPQERELPTPSTGEEKVNIVSIIAAEQLIEALPELPRFSSWLRLIRATARVLQFLELCRRQTHAVAYKRTRKNAEPDPTWTRAQKRQGNTEPRRSPRPPPRLYHTLEGRHMRAAEHLWVRALQQQNFRDELSRLTGGRTPARDSRLSQLSLLLDVDGVLRLRSRIARADDISASQKRPAILDGDHPYCRLYIDWIHRQLHHGGVEHVVNEVRQSFWVLRVRPTVRGVIKRCQPCRLRRATAPVPPTGDHPTNRLAHHQRPFTYTGLDYFGPISVTVGRQHHKRYVALFTCLTTRAVHLEVATSLSTDSAILALRRMMARRGCPREIWSDNGTNLRGADAELRRAALDATTEEAGIRAIQWRFIPPGAPFMGGAWERLVRSVKVALATVLHERHPQEEVLATLLTEAEHTVNSRPLSHVSVSSDDDEALTPNHFLLGGPSRVPLPGTFTEGDTVRRGTWRAAQQLANAFWSRWVREVLPLLQQRRDPHGRGAAIQVGDVVIVADGSLPRNVWPKGVVQRTYPGEDGIVRAVDVRTKGGTLRRPTKKLIVLPVDAATSLPE